MTVSTNLALPLLQASQAQKHFWHNEALLRLDTLVQLAVVDRDLNAPPASPQEGERWIVGAGPSGAWSGYASHIAAWQDGDWQFNAPQPGWIAYVIDEGTLLVWDGAAWIDLFAAISALQNLDLLGVGATADATNPFSAKLNNALWAARTVAEGGDGSLRYKMSKESAADTLSLLMQTNFSGRAEIGLAGDDDLHVKVSADGSAWREALIADRATGGVRFLVSETDVASAATCDIGAAPSLRVNITGATAIASFGTAARTLRFIRFAGALTLTHNASTLSLPGGANIVTAAGDAALAISDASGAWRVVQYQRASGRPVSGVQVDVFASSGTWSKPSWCTAVRVVCIGGGGGGGAGRRGAVGTVRTGGAGGGGGTYADVTMPATLAGATESVTVGAGGAGEAAIATDDTGGTNTAASGGLSSFGAHVRANGGQRGQTGSTGAASGGVTGQGMFSGASGASSSGTGGAGSQGGRSLTPGGGGGSSGGGVTSGNVDSAGGDAGLPSHVWYGNVPAAPGGAASTGNPGGAGQSVTAALPMGGGGGAGGGSNSSGAAGAGGAGGNYGAGGGGGGASLNGHNSGAGGDGAPGLVIVFSM